MNFSTANNTFRQLMVNGLLYQVPPPFQRNYSWSADKWDDFWQCAPYVLPNQVAV